ncbi:MAG: ATP-binding protein [Syntrophobacteraceae bacterium]|jgi:PAS domain S-box-containing protein
MADKTREQRSATALRNEAEKRLAHLEKISSGGDAEDIQKLVHQLLIHQLELEMQNGELRKTQAQLEESRNQYADLYDFAPLSYFTLDEQGRIIEMNLTGVKQLGIERGNLINIPFVTIVVESDWKGFFTHLKKVFDTHEGDTCEVRLRAKESGEFFARLDSIFMESAKGTGSCRTSVTDITQRKRAEAALLESEQRVRRLNEHILNMVMVLSHDIRGPLVAIASILKLLLRGVYGKLDQSPANTVQELLSRCARLLGTAEDYLGKASIVGGPIEMEREVLDLRQDIIDAVLNELADDIIRREIVIDNRLGAIPAGSISICANKTWLKAVYRNLFTNAAKYGGKGCTISFGFEQRESHYRLNVYNSGIPIAEEDREKIFDRFGRIEPLEGHTPDGVGLGLYLCREIILEHGGEIWYEARPDGSNFVFTISREDECLSAS